MEKWADFHCWSGSQLNLSNCTVHLVLISWNCTLTHTVSRKLFSFKVSGVIFTPNLFAGQKLTQQIDSSIISILDSGGRGGGGEGGG